MKAKDLVALAVLAVILILVGSLLISKLGRGGESRQAQIEVVQPIDPIFSEEARDILSGRDSRFPTQTFSGAPDLGAGLGNTNPFRAQ